VTLVKSPVAALHLPHLNAFKWVWAQQLFIAIEGATWVASNSYRAGQVPWLNSATQRGEPYAPSEIKKAP